MTFSGDPYRTLGLQPGATLDEIKRAYRRLAKQYHPDSAGPAATRRFLVIQGAYEALVRTRDVGERRGSTSTSSPSPSGQERGRARRPWEADPDRARSTRERYAGRGWGRGRAANEDGRGAGPDSRQGPGSGFGHGDASGARHGDAPGSAAAGDDPSGGGSAGTSGRRSAPRARPGSTSYDGVAADGRTPPWDGATWYGAASGTYWTINPKEYADPRKHGPEYLQRGRRGATRTGDGVLPEDDRGAGERASWPDDVDGTRSSRTSTGRAGERRPSTGPSEETPPPPAPARKPTPAEEASGELRSARAADRREPGDRRSTPRRGPAKRDVPDRVPPPGASSSAAVAEPAADPALDAATTPTPLAQRGRILLAALGWPPLGFAVLALMGDATGCARFSASCADPGGAANPLLQLAIQALIFCGLLAVPALARPAAVATLAVLAAAVPSAIVLVSFGGARAQSESQLLLLALLAIAYGAGIGIAFAWPEHLPEPFGRRTMGG